MQVREQVGKSSWFTVFFSMICGSGGSTSIGSLKRRVRSQLARWEMKNCTPLWREAHFQVKMYKTHHARTTFGSWDVEKVHAVVAQSTFPSQHAKITTCWVHYTTLHYTTLHHSTLHYTTLHFTTLHSLQPSLQLHYKYTTTTLHSTPLHSTTTTTTTRTTLQLHYNYTTLHYTTLHYTTLRYTTLHHNTLHYTTLNYATLRYTTLNHNYNYNYNYTWPITLP